MTSYYDDLFASHPDPMWIFDLETLAFLDVNQAALSDYGYSREQFLRMTLADVRPEEDVPLMLGTIAESKGRATQPALWRHKRRDGTVFDVEVRTHPITFNGRKAKVATLHNVSALTAARAHARQLEQRLQRKLNRISDGYYTLDREWTITFVNRKACELAGRKAEDLVGRNIWTAYPTMQNSVYETEFKRAVAEQVQVEFTDHARFGRWFEVRAFPNEEGLAVFFKDLSRQRRDESQIQLLEAAVAHINDIVIITEATPLSEPGPRIVYVNDAFTRISGYRREEALGRSPRFLHGPDTQVTARAELTNALSQQKPFRTELINYSKTQEEYWVEMEIVPITGRAGTVTHFVAVQRDVTARKRQERALAISEERFRIVSQTTSDVIWD